MAGTLNVTATLTGVSTASDPNADNNQANFEIIVLSSEPPPSEPPPPPEPPPQPQPPPQPAPPPIGGGGTGGSGSGGGSLNWLTAVLLALIGGARSRRAIEFAR